MAQAIGARFLFGGRGRNPWRKQREPILYPRRPRAQPMAQSIGARFILLRPRAQPMTQAMGNPFMLGGRGRNPWRIERLSV